MGRKPTIRDRIRGVKMSLTSTPIRKAPPEVMARAAMGRRFAPTAKYMTSGGTTYKIASPPVHKSASVVLDEKVAGAEFWMELTKGAALSASVDPIDLVEDGADTAIGLAKRSRRGRAIKNLATIVQGKIPTEKTGSAAGEIGLGAALGSIAMGAGTGAREYYRTKPRGGGLSRNEADALSRLHRAKSELKMTGSLRAKSSVQRAEQRLSAAREAKKDPRMAALRAGAKGAVAGSLAGGFLAHRALPKV